jgi:hypothetical protein
LISCLFKNSNSSINKQAFLDNLAKIMEFALNLRTALHFASVNTRLLADGVKTSCQFWTSNQTRPPRVVQILVKTMDYVQQQVYLSLFVPLNVFI